MEKTITASKVNSLVLKIDSGAEIEVTKCNTGDLTIQYSCVNPALEIKNEQEGSKYTFKLSDPKRKAENSKFLEDIISTKTILGIFGSIDKKFKEMRMAEEKIDLPKVKVSIPAEVKGINISINNGTIRFSSISLDRLKIKGNKVKIKARNRCSITEVQLEINKSKLKMELNPECRLVRIEANHSRIKFNKASDYQGQIICKGNNMKVEGDIEGDSAKGEVTCTGNLTKIKIVEPEFNKYV